MCPLDSRVCVSSASQSLVTPASFTGLWKESSCGGDEAAGFPALPADEEQTEERSGPFLSACRIITFGKRTFSVVLALFYHVVVLWEFFDVPAPVSCAVA